MRANRSLPSRGRDGFLMVEIILAALVVGIAAAAVTTMLGTYYKASDRARMSAFRQRLIGSVVERVRDNPAEFQTAYLTSETDAAKAELDSIKAALPLAYKVGSKFYVAAQCADCPGRLGVAVQRVPSAPSLSVITIFVKDERVFPNGEVKTFKFVASPVR